MRLAPSGRFRAPRLPVPFIFLLLVLLFFWRPALGLGVFGDGDFLRIYYPLRVAHGRSLGQLSLPLWTPYLFSGYPLLAEGEIGALYPPNMLLALLLPAWLALNYSALVPFLISGPGMYAFLRHLGLSRLASLFGGMVFAYSGFFIGHLSHPSIIAAAAWLPLLFLLGSISQERLKRGSLRQALPVLSLFALLAGLELLAGHPQMSFLSLAATSAYILWGGLYMGQARGMGRTIFLPLLALGLGLGVGAVQLLPTWELVRLSERGTGLTADFLTSFSLRPQYLVSLLHPFILGNPYPKVSVELNAYVGLLPLMLASIGLLLRRKEGFFFGGLALVGLAGSFGRWNPLYRVLLWIPPFSLFRVPPRFLFWFVFGASVLAALGLEALLERKGARPRSRDGVGLAGGLILALALSWIARESSVERLVGIWQWLPWLLGLASLGMLSAFWQGGLDRRGISALALSLVVFDLYAHAAVYGLTYNRTLTPEQFLASPRSLDYIAQDPGLYRIYTHQALVPAPSVQREALYPNISLTYSVQSAGGYLPLKLERYRQYMEALSPRMLDLLNVKYFLIPQLLPVDEAAESYDLENPFALSLTGRSFAISPTPAVAVEVESFISHSARVPQGQRVAEIVLSGEGGEAITLPLRAGIETAEWAYERADVRANILPQRPDPARTWPARSGYPPSDHPGYTYRARYGLSLAGRVPFTVTGGQILAHYPQGFIHLERVSFLGPQGERWLLSHLLGQGDHTLAYRSEDVALYQNHDYLLRAFIVHRAQVMEDEKTLALLAEGLVAVEEEVILAEGAPLALEAQGPEEVSILSYGPDRMALKAHLSAPGYLVLADPYYPGWRAWVDGQEQPIQRADYLFQAVYLPAGEHLVEWTYAPTSFRVGMSLSLASLAIVTAGLLPGLMRLGCCIMRHRIERSQI